jgi:hypothetical protein
VWSELCPGRKRSRGPYPERSRRTPRALQRCRRHSHHRCVRWAIRWALWCICYRMRVCTVDPWESQACEPAGGPSHSPFHCTDSEVCRRPLHGAAFGICANLRAAAYPCFHHARGAYGSPSVWLAVKCVQGFLPIRFGVLEDNSPMPGSSRPSDDTMSAEKVRRRRQLAMWRKALGTRYLIPL